MTRLVPDNAIRRDGQLVGHFIDSESDSEAEIEQDSGAL